MKSKNNKVKVFIDGVDWMYEVGAAADGNKVYPDINCLKKYNRCWDGCGIVECELVFKKWVIEHDWDKMSKASKNYTAKELKENSDKFQLEAAQKRLEWLQEQVSTQAQKTVEMKVNLKRKNK